ncbi:DUF2303 family protein [Massilia aerilata]|uniref:DUF2303 family protein n=1 Tax=Massilia aerilata TaxID=453817 RepID=A0ABW0RY37_9BURK
MNESQNASASGIVAGQLAAAVQTQEHLQISDSAIAQLGALTVAAANVRAIGDAHFLILPPDYKHIDVTKAIENALPEPYRKSGAVVLSDLPSFLQYVADQAAEDSCYIYAHADTRALVAVLNDHEQGHGGLPAWRDFRVSYTAELSREFSAWYKNDRKPMDQEEFAVFLEDNVADISEPSGETMLQVALTLQAKTEVAFSSHRRLDNGQVQLTYTENIDARAGAGDIMIPREFALGLRLFKNGDGYKVRARLKYRLGGGKVKFWYELDRVENAIEDAFNAYVDKARESGFTVLIGKP